MSDIICVTNRKLCREDFLLRINKIAECKPKAIILREKDLTEGEYEKLAYDVLKICNKFGVQCILHSFIDVAIKLNTDAIHLPLSLLVNMTDSQKKHFDIIGASCHSAEDAVLAQRLGSTYITAGHVFDTDCKKGLPGRGLDFLSAVCKNVNIPVYAIGGISGKNINDIRKCGATGACIMSGLMVCENPREYLSLFRNEEEIDV